MESMKLQDYWQPREKESSCDCLVSNAAAKTFQKQAEVEVIIGAY